MSQMQVTIPAGIGPGMPFQVNKANGPMQVVCPQNAQGGMEMMVNVPAQQAVPMVQAVATPVITGQV